MLLRQLRSFYFRHQPYDMERLLEYFAVFGGLEITLDIDAPIEAQIEHLILEHYGELYNAIAELTLGESDYRRLLRAIARGDRRIHSATKRARLGKERAEQALAFLRNANIIEIEYSREQPPERLHPKQRLKREIERHRISHKIRFTAPFFRFWYYFVTPFHSEIERGEFKNFFDYFAQHAQSFYGLLYEEVSNLLLQAHFADDPIIDSGSYWDRHVEIDLLAQTQSGKNIVGECKWTNHKINKSELTKLHDKCERAGIEYDVIVLFSKRGYSNELNSHRSGQLLLFTASDIEQLLVDITPGGCARGLIRLS